ncbi:hypothetical protein [Paenarthrobacter nitroguajacolicus]|uniref:hypothetical protein n=1 Tax=Paenarthrobacter nitroguajacolicus TaxID=211146 RepID=UPI00344A4BEC
MEAAPKDGARIAAVTIGCSSPLASLSNALMVIPAAQKTDHGSDLSPVYTLVHLTPCMI